MTSPVEPFSLKDAPALIERLLPVQKLSAEAYKEQMAVHGKTLTALGGYWKGRKPLILNKACILGCLLPATGHPALDLKIFEMLMGMDIESLEKRLEEKNSKESRFILDQHRSVGYGAPYRQWVDVACRPEECGDDLFSHIWDTVNLHLGTSAGSFTELVEQLGIMRYGHRPRFADTFCGSGQIPFEAARLGCNVYATDLNPVACMLTWGAFTLVGGSPQRMAKLVETQRQILADVRDELDSLGVETDGTGWRAKVFLYCNEVRCPQSGWLVPLLPSLVISKGYRVIAELHPQPQLKRYRIAIRTGVSDGELRNAATGTIQRDDRYGDAFLVHTVKDVLYRTKISTIKGEFVAEDGSLCNRVRPWDSNQIVPQDSDIFQERLFCIQWMRPKTKGSGDEYEFREIDESDLDRDRIVRQYVQEHLAEWQSHGWAPEMRIEPGEPPRYQGLDLIRSRGWTHWLHVFNPRQLLIACLVRKRLSADSSLAFSQSLNSNSRLSPWSNADGGGGAVKQTFANQALNTLFTYGCRGLDYASNLLQQRYKVFPLPENIEWQIEAQPVMGLDVTNDIYVTDPPYGDAVKYEEIFDFFIAWLRKNPPDEFAKWVWDSRRALAIKGEDEAFRRNMVSAYRRMTECMADNGVQVVMFTHQSGSIWADMANIVWASGLHVTAAWYVVTETDSALRAGSNVKGTVLLVLRKRQGTHKATRDDLAWEIQEEVEAQVKSLTGLNQEAKGLYRDENVFEDADIQMAGYAAALRVLTRYAIIDGRDMPSEAIRPRVKGETTFVDDLIAFAVDTANQCLVPEDIAKLHWEKLSGAERFYLKMLDMEARGAKTLDNYQNFAKAFKVRDFQALMSSRKANDARLKSAVEFGRSEMSEGSEFHQSVLRAVLYAVMELVKNMDGSEVLAHLTLNIPDFYGDMSQRDMAVELGDFLAKRLSECRPEEAAASRVLRELVKNQRLG